MPASSSASSAPQAAAPVPISAAHQRVVLAMLKALHLGELVMAGVQQRMLKNPNSAYVGELVRSLDVNQFLDRLTPIFAATYSETDASTITQTLQSVAGAKFVGALIQAAQRGGPYRLEDANLSNDERLQLAAFLQTPTGYKFMQFGVILQGPAVQAAIEEWVMAVVREKMASAAGLPPPAALRAEPSTEPHAAAGDAQSRPDPELQFIKQMAVIRTMTSLRAAQAKLLYSRELARWSQADLLSAQTLVSASAIAASKARLVSMGEALERNVQAQNTLLKEARAQYVALAMPHDVQAEFLQGVDERLAIAYDQQIRHTENQRAQFALLMQLLDFAQQRLGTIVAVNGNLQFTNSADQETYQRISGEIEEARRRGAVLANEALVVMP